MSRADARKVHREMVIPYFECTYCGAYKCLATMWRIGGFRSRGGAVSARSPALESIRVTGYRDIPKRQPRGL